MPDVQRADLDSDIHGGIDIVTIAERHAHAGTYGNPYIDLVAFPLAADGTRAEQPTYRNVRADTYDFADTDRHPIAESEVHRRFRDRRPTESAKTEADSIGDGRAADRLHEVL